MKLKKTIYSYFKRLFQVKNIIVVTDKSVDYYPLGRGSQLALILGVLGVVSWGSYSTGSFVAAKSQIAEKERKIEAVNEENRVMEGKFSMLKRDLALFNQHEGEISEYGQFVLDQYAEKNDQEWDKVALDEQTAKDPDFMMQRVAFLEGRVEQLKHHNALFIEAVRERTKEQIKSYEDIINMTGLNPKALELKQEKLSRAKNKKEPTKKKLELANHAQSDEAGEQPQGGPFVPEGVDAVVGQEKDLFVTIDKMLILGDVIEAMPTSKPMRIGRFTSGYGHRRDPFTKRRARHTGLDMAGPRGSRVRATADGKVIKVGRRGAYGNMVEIDHGLGITTRYGHLAKYKVRPGQKVKQGQIVGLQGNTGRSTGHHLHYEVRYHGTPYDPMKFIKAGKAYVSAQ